MAINLPEKAELKCLFCGSTSFEVEKENDGSIKKQEMFKCSQCKEFNSYEGMFEVCKEEVLDLAKNEVLKMIRSAFKK